MIGIELPIFEQYPATSEKVGLLTSSVVRTSERTVFGYREDDNIADGQSLLLVPSGIGAYPGMRLLVGNSWSKVDASGAALTYLGQSIAAAVTNVLDNSNAFDNVAWSKTGLSVVADTDIAPDGLTTADSLIEDTSTGAHIIQNGTALVGAGEAASYYVKANGRTEIAIQRGGKFSRFDLTAVTVPYDGGNGSYIVDVGNGWRRCVFVDSVIPSNASNIVYIVASGNTSYTGDGVSGVLIWGGQLENGPVATPYIHTTSVPVTREADDVTITTPSLLTAQQGAIELLLTPDASGQVKTALGSYVDSNNYTEVFYTSTSITFRKMLGGITYDAVFAYTHIKDVEIRTRLKWDSTNGFSLSVANSSDDISLVAFITNANTGDMQLGANISIGSLNSSAFLYATHKDPVFYSSSEDAGW